MIQLSLEATVRRVLTAESRGLDAHCVRIASSPKCTQAQAIAWADRFYPQSRRTSALALQQIEREIDPTMSSVKLYPVESGLAHGAMVTYSREGSVCRTRLSLTLTLKTHCGLYVSAPMGSPTQYEFLLEVIQITATHPDLPLWGPTTTENVGQPGRA